MNGSSPLTRGTLFVDFDKSEVVAVHPRLRGELRSLAKISDQYHGSSPLTRGTHALSCRGIAVIRFIPAYAGNSTCITMVMGLLSVHPRLRGELKILSSREKSTFGSSPLTRGTPAIQLTVDRTQYGSSPLTRGTPLFFFCRLRNFRFIPAYAGNS